MKIYIDSECKCHLSEAEGLTPVNVPFFDNKCTAFITGYRFIPMGETWTREDGEVFEGEAAFPWKDSQTLELAQSAYEESLAEMQDMQAALELLGVTPTEDTVGGE